MRGKLTISVWTSALCAMLGACSSSGHDSAPTVVAGTSAVGGAGARATVAGTSSVGSGGVGVAGRAAVGGTSAAAGSGGITGGTAGSVSAAGTGAAGVAGAAAGTAAPVPDAGMQPVTAGTGAAPDAGMTASGTEIWIAPSGADSDPGTQDKPLASLAAAVAKAAAGTTIWVAPGTYSPTATVGIKANGTEDKPIRVFAQAGGERPVFDFKAQPRGESSARGIQISGTYWHLRGIDVINAGDNCIHISGSHNTIERVVTHGCSDTGVQITANSSEAGDANRAAYNTVVNCDSYENYDAQNQGENADGFAAKLYIGPGNVFRGCRAWNNADDGWDLFASDDVVVIENCWAMSNGKIGATQNNTNGDGNGFKLGGAAQAGDANMGGAVHQVKNCASIENRACGFVRNNNTKVPQLTMCGGRGDGKGVMCSLSSSGGLGVTMSASEAINAKRDADGNLPPLR